MFLLDFFFAIFVLGYELEFKQYLSVEVTLFKLTLFSLSNIVWAANCHSVLLAPYSALRRLLALRRCNFNCTGST
jgi:hypothetical protein